MTPGRLWYLLQRDWRRGLAATWQDRVASRRILQWRNPFANEPPQETPVHLLSGADDWLLACWMLASWFHATQRNWRVVIHDDGQLPPEAHAAFAKLIPGVRGIPAGEADRAVLEALDRHPACRAYRLAHPLARKIFDIPALTRSERFMILDSDVLFFRKPEAILRWCDEPGSGCWFNEDLKESLPIPPEEAREKLGLEIWPRVNSGLCLIERQAIDLDLCERALRETSLLKGHVWLVEQSLFAICASAYAKGGLLPPEYEVSLSPRARREAVARHYVGAVRQRFYADGIARIKGQLLRRKR
jgi:hypothetical protein